MNNDFHDFLFVSQLFLDLFIWSARVLLVGFVTCVVSDSGKLESIEVPYSWTSKAARRSTLSSRGPIDSCHRDTFFARSVDSRYS